MSIRFQVLSLMGTAMFLHGCSKFEAPESDPQPNETLELPDWSPEGDPFLLADGEKKYSGSILVWSDNPDPEDVESILVASARSRRLKAKLKRYTIETLEPLSAELTENKASLQRIEEEALANQIEAITVYMKSWYSEQLLQLGSQKIIEDSNAASTRMEAFCEAKIWELATDRSFVQSTYSERPSPFQICENYYADAGFFDPAEYAACDITQNDGDFFRCFWDGGIFQTRFFQDRYTTSNAAKIVAALDSGEILEWMNDQSLGPILTGGILAQRRLPPSFGSIRRAFIPQGGTPSDGDNPDLNHCSPYMVVAHIQDGPSEFTPDSLLLTNGANLSLTEQLALQQFHDDIRDLGERQVGIPSISDYLFHKTDQPLQQPLTYERVRDRESLAYIFKNVAPRFKTKIEAFEQSIADLETSLKEKESYSTKELVQPFALSLKESADAAASNGVSTGLWISSLLKIQRSQSETKIRFKLDALSKGTVDACWNNETKSLCDASADSKVSVTHDPETGLMDLRFTLSDASALGFSLNIRPESSLQNGEPFSFIPPESVDGKQMQLKLYPQIEDDILMYYSGKMFIKEADGLTTLYEGAVTLTEDL